MEFKSRFKGIRNQRDNILEELRKSLLPLILHGGGRNSGITKQMLEKNGICFALHCTDAEFIAKRPDLMPIEDAHKLYSAFNVFLDVMAYAEVYGKIKNVTGVNRVYCFDIDEYITGREHFTEDFLVANGNLLGSVYDLLDDDLSKDNFVAFISTRISGDLSYVKKYSVYETCRQYFDSSILNLTQRECFVDGGAFTGDTLRDLVEISGSRKHKIFAFEPDAANAEALQAYVLREEMENVSVIRKGLWSRKDILAFNSCGNTDSFINDVGNVRIEADSIDNVLAGEPVTFIKMDIEGAEYEALLGAKETISKQKPKLAISIYHRNEDLFRIPLLINSLCPEYKFKVRLHSRSTFEFVLYATINK